MKDSTPAVTSVLADYPPLQQAVEHASTGVLITDAQGTITYANQGFSRMSGYPPEEVIGRTPRFLQSGKTDAAAYRQMWQSISHGSSWQGEICNRHKDGHLYREFQTILPLVAPDGSVTAFVAVKEDVTEQHHFHLLHAALLRSSADAFVALDQDYRIIEWSSKAEQLFGLGQQQAIGSPFSERLHDAGAAKRLVRQMEDYQRLRKSPACEQQQRFTLRHADGSSFPGEISLAAVDLDGECRFIGFIRDISASVRAEQQLLQAQKMEAIGQLAGGMAHDFNNLLGIISGALELLALQQGEDNKYLALAQDASRRATDVSRALMAVARRHPIDPCPCDVKEMLRNLRPLLEQSAGKAIELELVADGEVVILDIEPTAFNNAVLNLVVNARDAMPAGGRLIVYTYPVWITEELSPLGLDLPRGPYLVIGVDDSGEGMSPTVAAKAFEPFFTTKEVGKGTGLGLAMVYSFCRQSGGIARIDSPPGKGCSIQMLLPVPGGQNAIDQ